jgi:hypothetical protein
LRHRQTQEQRFLEAAKSGDQGALVAIFGPDGKDVLFSGDAVKDKDALQDLVAAYGQMNRWREIKAGGEILYVGADNYPFPIPLGRKPSGQWYFDTAAGKDEILARRIGKGELTKSTINAPTTLVSGVIEPIRPPHRQPPVPHPLYEVCGCIPPLATTIRSGASFSCLSIRPLACNRELT